MKNKPVLAAGLAAGLLAAAAFGAGQAPAGKERPSALIRRDLLTAPRPEAAASARDLFVPGEAKPVGTGAGRPARPGAGPAPGASPGMPGAALETAETGGLLIRYLGYVRAERGMVALVLVDSLPLAAAEGEDLRPGWRVAKIAPDRLEVAGPDGVLKPVLREGELP